MNRYQIFVTLGLASVTKQTYDLANNGKTYLTLCPYCEMAQSSGSFHHLFVAVSIVGEYREQVWIEAGGCICMGAAMLICNHS